MPRSSAKEGRAGHPMQYGSKRVSVEVVAMNHGESIKKLSIRKWKIRIAPKIHQRKWRNLIFSNQYHNNYLFLMIILELFIIFKKYSVLISILILSKYYHHLLSFFLTLNYSINLYYSFNFYYFINYYLIVFWIILQIIELFIY